MGKTSKNKGEKRVVVHTSDDDSDGEERPPVVVKRRKKQKPKETEPEMEDGSVPVAMTDAEIKEDEASDARVAERAAKRAAGKDPNDATYLMSHTEEEKCQDLRKESSSDVQSVLDRLAQEDGIKRTAMAPVPDPKMTEYERARMQASKQPNYFAKITDEQLKTVKLGMKRWDKGDDFGFNLSSTISSNEMRRPFTVCGPVMVLRHVNGYPFGNYVGTCSSKLKFTAPTINRANFYLKFSAIAYDPDNAVESDKKGVMYDKDAILFHKWLYEKVKPKVVNTLLEPGDRPQKGKEAFKAMTDKYKHVLRSECKMEIRDTMPDALRERALQEKLRGCPARFAPLSKDEIKERNDEIEAMYEKDAALGDKMAAEAKTNVYHPGTAYIDAKKNVAFCYGQAARKKWDQDSSKKLDPMIEASPFFRQMWEQESIMIDYIRLRDGSRVDQVVPIDEQKKYLRPGVLCYGTFEVVPTVPGNDKSRDNLGFEFKLRTLVVVGFDEKLANMQEDSGFSVPDQEDPTTRIAKVQLPDPVADNDDAGDVNDILEGIRLNNAKAAADKKNKTKGAGAAAIPDRVTGDSAV